MDRFSLPGLIDAYSDFSNLAQETKQDLREMDRLALERSQLVIFSSDWAAQTAINYYQTDPHKVKIIPSGANINCDRTLEDIENLVASRSTEKCQLLFLGVDWLRKGGETALQIAKELHKADLDVELNVVGCQVQSEQEIPDYINSLGYIKKSSKSGLAKLNNIIATSHFLITPSRAETYGNVLCEANSFGVPCVATKVGGIPTVIREGFNGKAFPLEAEIREYSNYIYNLFTNYSQYQELALSSFGEYQTRLNWTVAGKAAAKLLAEKEVVSS